ncbi:hypothetical protein FSP39_000892 [Pinctada imbricata]|uniref:Short-chain collagen C4-like n=1 Tax=Pinctada imbricata TaxID=66713 RepID=A0AA89BS20_PINIB|nr:hypothetical protein FSP39_000892 [Pinctada imbricata]
MPHDPQFLGSLSGSYVNIYGGEYESSNFGDTRLSDGNDIPCAVCQSKRGVQKMVIPAKIKCPESWTKQYAGYLATSYGSKAAAEYICMDQNPTAAHGGHQDNEGAMVIPVKAACGALPCPPYKSGDTITCVVCTK